MEKELLLLPPDRERISRYRRQEDPESATLRGEQLRIPADRRRIFMCYRHADEEFADMIDVRLRACFGEESVLRDCRSIPPGAYLPTFIPGLVSQCSVMLVLIGEPWLGMPTQNGGRRLDDEADYVRIEIESALRRCEAMERSGGKAESALTTVPVLLRRAAMPKAEELPPTMQGLTKWAPAKIRAGRDMEKDLERLLQRIQNILAAG